MLAMSLFALSSLDGRYSNDINPLRDHFSEFGYLRNRTRIELDFITALSKLGICPAPAFSIQNFTEEDALKIQAYEKTTRHDVKAIEYYLREKLPAELHPWIHFGLTSEDVNNITQAIALRDSRDAVLVPALHGVDNLLRDFAKRYRSTPMLARTHGQPAVPTTFGKEIAVYIARLRDCLYEIQNHTFQAKLTGAVGNFNAMYTAFPDIDWIGFSTEFIKQYNLVANTVTTQILPYDNWIRYFDKLKLTNSILIDFAQDMWTYISDGYLLQKRVEEEVGSSTMPQKINPIDFENAEGNLGVANSLFAHYAEKLSASRLQRDLSDSTVRRTFGSALGHTLLAWKNISKGISRVEVDETRMKDDLNAHWEVVSEGAQTILRAAGQSDAYESLKIQMRGTQMNGTSYKSWVEALAVNEKTRESLLSLSPESYLGVAVQLTDNVLASKTKQSPNSS